MLPADPAKPSLPATPPEVYPLSVAPMMDRTDRHFRWFMRQITRHTLLYTEMVTTGALIHGDVKRHLAFDPQEKPLALQLGGDDPDALKQCVKLAEDFGYDEVNLNVGCPSDRVQRGSFGVCLMKTPERVADVISAMASVTHLPITVKHRIGVDELDRYEDMLRFVDIVAKANPTRFTVHARKAWLQGLSPKENRDIPPLRYHDVYRLKQERPHLRIEINGGFKCLQDAKTQLQHVDAVMMGRAAYDHPFAFAEADALFYGSPANATTCREAVVEALIPYAEQHIKAGVPPVRIARAVMHLFFGQPGARGWKRTLAEESAKATSADVFKRALERVPLATRRAMAYTQAS